MGKTIMGHRPLGDYMLVNIFDDGDTTIDLGGGVEFIMLSDSMFGEDHMKRSVDDSHPGIRPRWAMVMATSDQAEEFGINIGDKVLCEQMRWSRGFEFDDCGRRVWRILPDNILGIDEDGFTEGELKKIRKWLGAAESGWTEEVLKTILVPLEIQHKGLARYVQCRPFILLARILVTTHSASNDLLLLCTSAHIISLINSRLSRSLIVISFCTPCC